MKNIECRISNDKAMESTKHEIRNTKEIQMRIRTLLTGVTKIQNSKRFGHFIS
jgi:hypothetical protein